MDHVSQFFFAAATLLVNAFLSSGNGVYAMLHETNRCQPKYFQTRWDDEYVVQYRNRVIIILLWHLSLVL